MDLTGGLAATLPADIKALMDRVDALEAQSAKDVQAIADKVLAELKPMIQSMVDAVNTLTVTGGAAVQETMTTVRRLDGMTVIVKLGPEPGA